MWPRKRGTADGAPQQQRVRCSNPFLLRWGAPSTDSSSTVVSIAAADDGKQQQQQQQQQQQAAAASPAPAASRTVRSPAGLWAVRSSSGHRPPAPLLLPAAADGNDDNNSSLSEDAAASHWYDEQCNTPGSVVTSPPPAPTPKAAAGGGAHRLSCTTPGAFTRTTAPGGWPLASLPSALSTGSCSFSSSCSELEGGVGGPEGDEDEDMLLAEMRACLGSLQHAVHLARSESGLRAHQLGACAAALCRTSSRGSRGGVSSRPVSGSGAHAAAASDTGSNLSLETGATPTAAHLPRTKSRLQQSTSSAGAAAAGVLQALERPQAFFCAFSAEAQQPEGGSTAQRTACSIECDWASGSSSRVAPTSRDSTGGGVLLRIGSLGGAQRQPAVALHALEGGLQPVPLPLAVPQPQPQPPATQAVSRQAAERRQCGLNIEQQQQQQHRRQQHERLQHSYARSSSGKPSRPQRGAAASVGGTHQLPVGGSVALC